MIKFFLPLLLFSSVTFATGESRFKDIIVSNKVAIGTSQAAASSSILDLTSTTKGLLPPRMTNTQRDAISSPAAGLGIYNTTTGKYNLFNSAWQEAVNASDAQTLTNKSMNGSNNTFVNIPLSTAVTGQLPQANGTTNFWTRIGNSGTTFQTDFLGTADSASMAIKTNGVTRMTIGAGGEVGIGTTAPGASLDIKGAQRFSGFTSGYVGLKAPAVSGSTTYSLPSADGSSGQVLSTNGTGTMSWINPSGTSTTYAATLHTCGSSTTIDAASPNASAWTVSTISAGKCTLNFNSSFSTVYACTVTVLNGSPTTTDSQIVIQSQSNTSIDIWIYVSTTLTSEGVNVICVGN